MALLFQRMTPKKLLLIILLMAAILRVLFYSGYVSGDDRAYIAKAFTYSQGNFSAPSNHWETRSGIVGPLAISYYLFGVSIFSTGIVPYILSLISVVVTYQLAFLLFDKKVGLLAAFLLSIFPMDVLFSSQLFPYEFLVFFSSLSMLSFVYGEKANNSFFIFISGLLLGYAYLCRITAMYCLLFYGLYFLFYKKYDLRKIALFSGGVFFFAFAEAFVSQLVYGNWFFRFKILMEKVTGNTESEYLSFFDKYANFQWLIEPFVRPIFEQEFGIFFIFFALSVYYQIRVLKKNKNTTMLLLWIIPLFLYISFGTTSPTDYHPLRRLPRYYSVIIIQSIILLSYVLINLKYKYFRIVVVMILSVSSIFSILIDNSLYIKHPLVRIVNATENHSRELLVIDRPFMFDYLYLNQFKKNNNLYLLVNPTDVSDTLGRIETVFPDIKKVYEINHIRQSAIIILSPNYFNIHQKDFLELERIKNIKMEFNPFYKMVLNSWPVKIILKHTRDKQRFRELYANSKVLKASIYSFSTRK